MTFTTWIDTFISEKGLNLAAHIEVEGPSGLNIIPLECLIDQVKAASGSERNQIKNALVRLDFSNAPIMPFFKHIAQAIAI